MTAFVAWLRDTPIHAWLAGGTTRSVLSIRGRLRTLRAFRRVLADAVELASDTAVPLPKLPETNSPC